MAPADLLPAARGPKQRPTFPWSLQTLPEQRGSSSSLVREEDCSHQWAGQGWTPRYPEGHFTLALDSQRISS
jgi:hypothetical protein